MPDEKDRTGVDEEELPATPLHAHGSKVEESERRDRYRATVKARIDWEPREPEYHVFAVDVDSAGFVTFAEGNRYGLAWSPDGGLRRWKQRES